VECSRPSSRGDAEGGDFKHDGGATGEAARAKLVLEMPGRYAVVGDCGHGSQAWVFAVRDTLLGRDVAMKSLHGVRDGSGQTADSTGHLRSVRRFLREIQIAGRLMHPNIVHLYDAGRRADGALYYTMPLVRGRTLDQALSEAPDAAARRAHLGQFLALCNGIAFAHSRGVIHRDIKPSNVMLGEFGETLILDWGLATETDRVEPVAVDGEVLESSAPERTVAGMLLGTPSYMSPEQAGGRVDEVDERSDIWGLGAVLYHILTGGPPHQGQTASEIVAKAQCDPVAPIRMTRKDAPPELAAIAEKALARDKQDRYASAKQMADDVNAYMTGERVQAHQYGTWQLLRRIAARHKAVATASVLVFVALVVSTVVTSASYRREQIARSREAVARIEEREARVDAQMRLSRALIMRTQQELDMQAPLAARVFAAAALQTIPGNPNGGSFDPLDAERYPESRRLLVEAASQMAATERRTVRALLKTWQLGHPLQGLAVAQNGAVIATFGAEQGVEIWRNEVDRWRKSDTTAADLPLSVALSPSGRLVATGGRDGRIVLREVATGSVVRRLFGHEDTVRALVFTPAGRTLVSGARDGTLRFWDVESGTLQAKLNVQHPVMSIAVAPDGKTLATAGRDGVVGIWEKESRRRLASIRATTGVLEAVAFSADGRFVAAGGVDKTARVWDWRREELVGTMEGHGESVVKISYSPLGRHIATLSRDGIVRLWDAASYSLSFASVDSGAMVDVAFVSEPERLVTCAARGAVQLWELERGDAPSVLRGHRGIVFATQYSPDGLQIASGGADSTVRLWDARTGQLERTLTGHQQSVFRVEYSPDGRLIASVSRDRTARIWNVTTGRVTQEWADESAVYGLAISPNGETVATSTTEGKVMLRPMAGGEGKTLQQPAAVFALAYSPNGERLASAGGDGVVRILNALDGETVQSYKAHSDLISDLVFSPRGHQLATAGKDAVARIWEAETGALVHELREHEQWVNMLAYSRDGQWLATTGDDRKTILWRTSNWEPELYIRGASAMNEPSFSTDGKTLAIGETDGIPLTTLDLAVRNVDPTQLLEEAQRISGLRLDGFALRPLP